MKTETIIVKEMHCSGCVRNIEKAVSQVNGVKDVKAELAKSSVTVSYDGGDETREIIKKTLEDWGFPTDEN